MLRLLRPLCLASTAIFCLAGGLRAETPFLPPKEAARELSVGDLLPDLELTSEGGRKIRVSDFREKALAITFIYSRCSSATLCPMVSQNFDATQALLVRLGLNDRCHLLSISLDPEHDTPEVLASYEKGHHADPQMWNFATAPEAAVREFGKTVGLEFKRSLSGIDHNLRTVVIDPSGRISRIFRGNGWTAQELAVELRKASAASRSAGS